jgi:galactokinase
MYEPIAINEKDKQVLNTLRNNAVKNLLRMEEDLQTMSQAVKTYREALTDSMELSIEEADIVCKYSTKPTLGSYSLPAVMVGSRANYDLASIKEDNGRLEELKDLVENARKQVDAYRRILASAFTDLNSEMKKTQLFATNIEQALNILRDA